MFIMSKASFEYLHYNPCKKIIIHENECSILCQTDFYCASNNRLVVNIKEGLCSKLSEVWAVDLYLSASQRNIGSMAYAF